MKTLLTVSILATLTAGPVCADCAAPNDDVQIPNGNSATREQMLAAQRAVRAYNAEVKQFADCLQQEQDAKVAAGGDQAKLAEEYAKRQNAVVDKLQQIADKFNVELKAFKTKNAT